ncbi:MAG: hypothetical protein ACKO6N_19460 [Myxococcota bacterium]
MEQQQHSLKRQEEGPYISVNKLGEYLVARPGRRRGILDQLKHPNPYALSRYLEAKEAIVEYLTSGSTSPDCIYEAMQRMAVRAQGLPPGYTQQDLMLSIEALRHFLELRGRISLEGYEVVEGSENPPTLHLGRLAVTVKPEVLLRRQPTRGRAQVGAIKLHFSREHPLNGDGGRYVAALTHRYLEEYVAREGAVVSPTHCLFIDVFSESVVTAPPAYRRRRVDMEAACAEISACWSLPALPFVVDERL